MPRPQVQQARMKQQPKKTLRVTHSNDSEKRKKKDMVIKVPHARKPNRHVIPDSKQCKEQQVEKSSLQERKTLITKLTSIVMICRKQSVISVPSLQLTRWFMKEGAHTLLWRLEPNSCNGTFFTIIAKHLVKTATVITCKLILKNSICRQYKKCFYTTLFVIYGK